MPLAFRIGLAVGAVLVLLLASVALLWQLAYGYGPEVRTDAILPTLSAEATIWQPREGLPVIEAANDRDLYAALGYLHGSAQTWPLVLLRQAALGELGEWFGEAVQEHDAFTRQLGISETAQRAYSELNDADRAIVDAYGSALAEALASPDSRLTDELTLLDVPIQPWQPWHALAVERLVAWLSASPPSPALVDSASASLGNFAAADLALRRWLHLHGFDRTNVWMRSANGATTFHADLVYGATALPFYLPVRLQTPTLSATAVSLPGTTVLPMVHDAGELRLHLFNSPVSYTQIQLDSTSVWPDLRYSRLRSNDGTERLVTIHRDRERIWLGSPAAGDSLVWTVDWTGFGPISDTGAWRRLLFAGLPDAGFRLFAEDGVVLRRSGNWTVTGTPDFTDRDTILVIGQSPWRASLASRLEGTPLPGSPLLGNVESPLAAEWAPRLVAPLLPSRQPDRPASVQEAVTYLSNWDHQYDRASIGASIFDAWLEAFVQDQGAYPLPDSLFADSLRTVRSAALLERTLRASVAELSRQYGTDQSSWRWENVQPNDRLYPVWSDSTLLYGTSSLSETKYAPLDVPAPGHASTLARHPSLANRLPAPSSFTFWGRTDTWDELNVQPDVRSRQGFLTRSLLTVRAAPIAVDRRQPNAGARLSLRPS